MQILLQADGCVVYNYSIVACSILVVHPERHLRNTINLGGRAYICESITAYMNS